MQCLILIVLVIIVSLLILPQIINRKIDQFRQKNKHGSGPEEHNCDKTQTLQNISQKIDSLLADLEDCKKNGQNAEELMRQLQQLQEQFTNLQKEHDNLTNQYNSINKDYERVKQCLESAEQQINQISNKLNVDPLQQPATQHTTQQTIVKQPEPLGIDSIPPGPSTVQESTPQLPHQQVQETAYNNDPVPNQQQLQQPQINPAPQASTPVYPNQQQIVNNNQQQIIQQPPTINNNQQQPTQPQIPAQINQQPTIPSAPAKPVDESANIQKPIVKDTPVITTGDINTTPPVDNTILPAQKFTPQAATKDNVDVIESQILQPNQHSDVASPVATEDVIDEQTPQDIWKRQAMAQLIDNPSQDPLSNMAHMLDLLDVPITDISDKFQNNNKAGGSDGSESKEEILMRFQQFIEFQYFRPLKLLNTSTMLYMIALTSYGRLDNLFNNLFGSTAKAALRSFITSVFIPLSPQQLILIEELTKDGDRVPCIQEGWYKRDMAILKRYYPDIQARYSPDSIQVMIHQLFNQLHVIIKNGEKVLTLLNNTNHKIALIDLLVDFQARIDNMFHIYQQSTKTYENVFQEFAKLRAEQQRIFTYVKIRQDDSSGNFEGGNPRYDVKWLPVSEYKENAQRNILVRYVNTDESFKDNNNAKDRFTQLTKEPSQYDKGKSKLDDLTEEYMFGPVDGAFLASDSALSMAGVWQRQLSEKLVQRRQSVCIFGYGQSGAGKTSTLVYLGYTNKQGQFIQEDGIVVHLCKALGNNTGANKAVRIDVSMVNFYVNQNRAMSSMADVEPVDGYATKEFDVDIKFTQPGVGAQKVTRKDIIFGMNGNIGWQPVVNTDKLKTIDSWKANPQLTQGNIMQFDANDFANQSLGFVINEGFSKREVEPTPNNPDSSRSHMIVFIDIIFAGPNDNALSQGKTKSQLIICDLAGVENKFQCSVMGEIFKFDEKYGVSGKYKKRAYNLPLDRNLCDSRHYMAKMSTIQKELKESTRYDKKTATVKGWDFGTDDKSFDKLGEQEKQMIRQYNGMSKSAKALSDFVNEFAKYYSTMVPGVVFDDGVNKMGGAITKKASVPQQPQGQVATRKIELKVKSLQATQSNLIGTEDDAILAEEKKQHLDCDQVIYNMENCDEKVKINQDLYNLIYNCKGTGQAKQAELRRKYEPISGQNLEQTPDRQKLLYVLNKHGIGHPSTGECINGTVRFNAAEQTFILCGQTMKGEDGKEFVPAESADALTNCRDITSMKQSIKKILAKNDSLSGKSNTNMAGDDDIVASIAEEVYYLLNPSIDSMRYLVARRVQELVATLIVLRYFAFCGKFDEGHYDGSSGSPPSNIASKYIQNAIMYQLMYKYKFINMVRVGTSQPKKYKKPTPYSVKLGNIASNTISSPSGVEHFEMFGEGDYVDILSLAECTALTDGMTSINPNMTTQEKAEKLQKRLQNILKARCTQMTSSGQPMDYTPNDLQPHILNLLGIEELKGPVGKITDFCHIDHTSTDDSVKKIQQILQAVLDKISQWSCLYFRLGKLQHNCELRLKEGYMINRALADLTSDLANIVKACMATDATMEDDTKALPLILAPNTLPYNINVYWQHDKYAEMYKPFTSDASGKLLGLLQQKLKTIGSKLTDLNFVVFTVINLTNNGEKNNPPNPPFINTNTAKYYIETEGVDSENANASMSKLITQLLDFKFYREYKQNVGSSTPLGNLLNSTSRNSAYFEGAIDIIDRVNDSTLLGTLQATEKIRNIPYDKYIESYDKVIQPIESLQHYSRSRTPSRQEARLFQVGRRDISATDLIAKHRQNDKYLGDPQFISDILKI